MKETEVMSDLLFALDILVVYCVLRHQLGDSPERLLRKSEGVV